MIVANNNLIGFLKSLFFELFVLLKDFKIKIYIFDKISYLISKYEVNIKVCKISRTLFWHSSFIFELLYISHNISTKLLDFSFEKILYSINFFIKINVFRKNFVSFKIIICFAYSINEMDIESIFSSILSLLFFDI